MGEWREWFPLWITTTLGVFCGGILLFLTYTAVNDHLFIHGPVTASLGNLERAVFQPQPTMQQVPQQAPTPAPAPAPAPTTPAK